MKGPLIIKGAQISLDFFLIIIFPLFASPPYFIPFDFGPPNSRAQLARAIIRAWSDFLVSYYIYFYQDIYLHFRNGVQQIFVLIF